MDAIATPVRPRQAIAVLLALAMDGRPKIRKRCHEALNKILKTPQPGPALDHPAADICAGTALNTLQSVVQSAVQSKKQRHRQDESHDPEIIHALQLTKTIAVASGGWPSKKIEALCEVLMTISKSTNEYLVMSAFEVFEVIFEGMLDELSSSKLPRLLEAIADLQPAQNDSQLLPPWIAVLSRGYDVSAQVEPEETFTKLPGLFDLISEYLTSPSHNIRVSASEGLISFLATCIPTSVVLDPSIYDEKVMDQLAAKANSLLAVKYQSAWMEVFKILAAIFDAFRWRGTSGLLPIVKAIGELRGNDSFQGKKEADEVLGSAIRNLGPETVLSVLPHNLDNPRADQPGRAWLLPLMRDHVSNTQLAHFRSSLVPLSEVMFQRVIEHGNMEKTMEIKIFETVVQQIWAIFPGYCDLPLDLLVAMDQQFAELVSNLLYSQPDLRMDLCRGLQNLVEANQAVIAADMNDEDLALERRTSKMEAEKNLEHLAKFSSNLLAVLFNVYSQTLPQHRAYILQCINAYLSITPEKDLIETFTRVSAVLESSIPKPDDPKPPKPQQKSSDKLPETSHTLIDLIIALSIYLPRSTFGALFSIAATILTNVVVVSSDPQLIKKAYKLIPRLATSTNGAEALKSRSSELQTLILATADKTPVPARRDRLLAITTLISFLPTSDLHFIPSVLSEIVIACKDTNEKARQAGFNLLIDVANRIIDPELNPPGTVIRNSKVPHMPADAPDAPATLEEVFTMVSAGLAGVAPHIVAATVSALSRLLFEFYDHPEMPANVTADLVATVEMFLQSNNREIVRAVLGFEKVAIVVLPEEIMAPRMPELVPGLMVWSNENKGRLRMKVKGILERAMRRFGAEKVERWVGEENRKIVVNIRKRKERSKRKGKGEDVDSDDDDLPKAGRNGTPRNRKVDFDNEFDEAVYGSDDDDARDLESGSEDGMDGVAFRPGQDKGATKSKRRGARDQYIRDAGSGSDDEPLDLLSPSAMASITSKKSVRFSNQAQRRTKARTNEDGKLVFGGEDDTDDGNADVDMMGNAASNGGNTAVDAYMHAVDGPDALRRGQKGRLKVKSGNQKQGRSESFSRGGDKMELDEDEAREVARKIMAGSASPRGAKGSGKLPQRRGLGIEKAKGRGSGGGNARPHGGFRRGGGGSGGSRGGRGGGRGAARGRGVRFGPGRR